VENPLSTRLLKGEFKEGDTVKVDLGDEGMTFVARAPARAAA